MIAFFYISQIFLLGLTSPDFMPVKLASYFLLTFRGLRKSGGKGKKQEKENARGSLDSRYL